MSLLKHNLSCFLKILLAFPICLARKYHQRLVEHRERAKAQTQGQRVGLQGGLGQDVEERHREEHPGGEWPADERW